MLIDLLKQFGAIDHETTAPPITLTRCLLVHEMDSIRTQCSLLEYAHAIVAQRIAVRTFKPDARLLEAEQPLPAELAAACRALVAEQAA